MNIETDPSRPPSPPPQSPSPPRAAGAAELAAVAALSACGALSALLELLFVPWYVGGTLVPVTVFFAVAGNIVLPRLARSVLPNGPATLAPFAAWLLVVVAVALFPRPEGDVIVPGGGGGLEWTGYGVLLGGAVAGTLTVLMAGTRPRR